MPTCPAGHTSASDDFCDVCGMRTGAAAGGPAGPLPEPPSPVPAEPCPRCGTARSGPFCTSCGYGYEAGQAPAAVTAAGAVPGGDGSAAESGLPSGGPPASGEPGPAAGGPPTAPGGAVAWTAVVASDHTYFEDVIAGGGPDAASLTFPAYIPERQFQLAGPEVRIGRRSPSQGLEPEIDLTGPPADPGVSRLHAVLLAEPDGSWAVLDPGSENGTHVNGSEIATGVRVPLGDGDRIHVGAWTVITIHAS
jgi:FHA domain